MPILDDISKGLKKGVKEAGKGIKKGVEGAGKGIKKGVEGAGKGIKQVSEKAGDAVKTFEIQQEISKLEGEIKKIKVEIGEKAFTLASEGKIKNPAIDKLVAKIDGINTQIEEKKAKIEEIKSD